MSSSQPSIPPLVDHSRFARAVEDSAKHLSGLSLAFLAACVYVGISVAATTNRVLLLGGDFELPLLKAEVPLETFYLVAPALLVVLHIHLLLQEHFLMQRLREWRSAAPPDRRSALTLFPALPVLRYGGWQPAKALDVLLDLMLFAINAALPLLILGTLQVRFLPYHSWPITLGHQFLILLDLWAIWYFLSKHERALLGKPLREAVKLTLGLPRTLWKRRRPSKEDWKVVRRVLAAAVATLGALYFVLGLAVVPGTWAERWCEPLRPEFRGRNLRFGKESIVLEPPASAIVARFIERGETVEDASRMHSVGVDLAERDLRGARFDGTGLYHADLSGADLRHAFLVGADLSGARLVGALLHDADLSGAQLLGADLSSAQLQRAKLEGADLRAIGALGAKFNRAVLRKARLHGAALRGASFMGADLDAVRAHGADFTNAQLQGAQLTAASLTAAELSGANAWGADFRRASLHGATGLAVSLIDLRRAHLGGICGITGLRDSDLRGVDFRPLAAEEWTRRVTQLQLKELQRLSPQARKRAQEAIDRLRAEPPDSPEKQAACLLEAVQDERGEDAASRGSLHSRGLLYDEVRDEPMQDWPLPHEQNPERRGVWSEQAYVQRQVKLLMEKACNNGPLAWTIARRAARKYNPGDPVRDQAFAEALAEELGRPTPCKEIRKLETDLKREVSFWGQPMQLPVLIPQADENQRR